MTAKTKRVGKFFGMPYDFRMPTLARMQERYWNPKDKSLFPPKVFGVGWTVNWYQVLKRLRLVK